MSKALESQYRLLLDQEKKFAKRVVYMIRAKTSSPWWHLFIPFKFLLEYFSLRKNVKEFTEKHLLVKRLALSAAYRTVQSGDRDKNRQQMLGELRDFWLHKQRLDSRELYELLGELADILWEHYLRLLEIPGKDYNSIVRRAYGGRGEYRLFLDRVEDVEKRIDRAAHDALNMESLDPHTRSRQEAMREVREQDVNDIFP